MGKRTRRKGGTIVGNKMKNTKKYHTDGTIVERGKINTPKA